MKYIKDVLKIIAYVAIFYIPVAIYSLWHIAQDINKDAKVESVRSLEKTNQLVHSLTSRHLFAEACQQLQAEHRAGRLVAYQLQSPDFICSFPETAHAMPETEAAGRVEAFQLKDIPVLVIRDQENGSEWYLGLNSPPQMTFFQYLRKEPLVQWAFAQEIMMVIYTSIALVLFAVLMMAKVIQGQFKDTDATSPFVRAFFKLFSGLQLHDLAIVRKATQVTTAFLASQKKDRDLLETSLEESILHEIRENHQSIPYSFEGTVTKVDINGFSRVVAASGSGDAFFLTNSLEESGCELLKRYNGLYDKTVGDEIVAVFKSKDSHKLAAAFARDVMREFSEKTFLISDNEPRKFTVKSAISSSKITFRKRHSGYGFDGDSLTHSTRLLEAVPIKDRNILSCQLVDSERIKELCHLPRDPVKFEFKNMPSADGLLIEAWIPVSEVYASAPDLLQFFRSDADVATLLDLLQNEANLEKVSSTLSTLRKIQVHSCNVSMIIAWRKALQFFHQKALSEAAWKETLSDVLMLGKTLIPNSQWNDECSAVVLGVSRNLDDRINASVAEVLAEKGVPSLVIEHEKNLLSGAPSKSFRTKGNVLLAHAIQKLDDKVFADLIKMMNSSNPLERHTGVYCTYNVIDHYKKQNPAMLELCSRYEKAESLLKKVRDSDPDLSPRLKEMTADL